MLEHISQSELRLFTVDIDGLLFTKEEGITWLQFTRRLYLLAGRTLEDANEAVHEHGRIYKKFHDLVKNWKLMWQANEISKEEYEDVYDEAYARMVSELMDLWQRSGMILTKQNIEQVIDGIIEEDIIGSESQILITFLIKVHEVTGIPLYLLSGTFLPLAQRLSQRLNFKDAEANALLIFGEQDLAYSKEGKLESIRSFGDVEDEEIFTGVIYTPTIDSKKLGGLVNIIQDELAQGQPKFNLLRNVLSLVDGDDADLQLANNTAVIAKRPTVREIQRNMNVQVVETYLEMIEAVLRRLPESRENILDCLPQAEALILRKRLAS